MSVDDIPSRRIENGKGLLLMAAGMFLFSAVDTTAKFLTDSLHPFQIVWSRQLGLLAGALFLLFYHGARVLKTHHPWLQLLRGGVAACSAATWAEYIWNDDPGDDPFATEDE